MTSPSGQTAAARMMRGSAALAVGFLLNNVGQLALIPVAIRYWGAARYGEWVALSAAVAFLTLTDVGVQSYVSNRMTALHATDKRDEVLALLHSALRVQVPLVFALWAVLAVVTLVLPTQSWLRLTTVSEGTLRLTLLILAAELLVAVPAGVVMAVYRSTGYLPRGALFGIGSRVSQLSVALLLIANGAGFPAVAFSRVTLSVATMIIALWDLHRLHAWFKLWPLGGSAGVGLRMLGPGSLFLLAGLADYLAMQASITVIQGALGATAVARYSTHRTLVNLARTVSSLLGQPATVEFTTLEARGENEQLLAVTRSLTKLNAWMVGFLVVGAYPVLELAYSAWTLRALAFDWPTMMLLGAQTLVWSLWVMPGTMLFATHGQRQLVIIGIINSLATFALAIIVVPRFGIRGAAAAGLVADVCIAAWLVPFAATRALKCSFGRFIGSVLPPTLGGWMAMAVVAVPVSVAVSSPWWRAIVIPLGSALLGGFTMWKLLDERERALAKRLGAALGRKFRRR